MTIVEVKASRGNIVAASSWSVTIATGEICGECDGGQIVVEAIPDDHSTHCFCFDCGADFEGE